MFNRGRDISLVSVLNWRDVMDNLIRFVRGVNTIDRHALKKGSLGRGMLDIEVVLSMKGVRQSDRKFDIPNLGTYKVWRGMINLEDHETGTYLVQWRTQFSTVSMETNGFGDISCRGHLSVDGIRASGPFGGDDYAPCMMPTAYAQKLLTYNQNNQSISGATICNLLPGQHLLDIDVSVFDSAFFEFADVSITRFNW